MLVKELVEEWYEIMPRGLNKELKKIYVVLCIATLATTFTAMILSILVYALKGLGAYLLYALTWLILFLITLYLYKSGVKRK